MSQCQRCGATNEPSSRFCVACGAPIAARSNPAASAPTAPPPPPPPQPPAPAPAWNPAGGSAPQAAVIHPYEGAPPSSSLQFAETAAPPTREEYEAARAARAAGAPGLAGRQSPLPGGGAAGYAPAASPVGAYAAGAQPATGAMPGVAQDPELLPEGAPRILAGFFISYDTQPLGRFWPIFQGKSRIGRQGAAPDLDIELDHPTASSRHAFVLAAACPGRVKLEDTGSTNGTLVNGARLAPGVRHELRDGDRVRFGLLSTIVKIV